jgi:hypothetical protein
VSFTGEGKGWGGVEGRYMSWDKGGRHRDDICGVGCVRSGEAGLGCGVFGFVLLDRDE